MRQTQEEHVGIIIMTYGHAEETVACLTSLEVLEQICTVYILDNGCGPEDTALLQAYSGKHRVQYLRSETNRGFAGGANFVLQAALQDNMTHIWFLNNDTAVRQDPLPAFFAALQPEKKICLVGARMLSFTDPAKVDNLGIAMYASCIASNRKNLSVPYFGPSGGCLFVTRECIVDMMEKHGEFFDEAFFAYAEDTDLCFRALHLGYTPAFLEDADILHKGSVTSGGKFNEFVMYQGLRNTLWMQIKNLPTGMILTQGFWIALLHCSVIFKYLVKGKFRLTWKIYADALRELPAMWKKRRRILTTSQRSSKELRAFCAKQFYEGAYILTTLKTLLRRDIEKSSLLPR